MKTWAPLHAPIALAGSRNGALIMVIRFYPFDNIRSGRSQLLQHDLITGVPEIGGARRWFQHRQITPAVQHHIEVALAVLRHCALGVDSLHPSLAPCLGPETRSTKACTRRSSLLCIKCRPLWLLFSYRILESMAHLFCWQT